MLQAPPGKYRLLNCRYVLRTAFSHFVIVYCFLIIVGFESRVLDHNNESLITVQR